MPIVYHGTIQEYAQAIQREGLKPEAREAFELVDVYGTALRSVEKATLPHVTTNLVVAKQYARFRASYERANRGQWIPGLRKGYSGFEKITDETKPTAKPAVVCFTLPESWELTPDKQDKRGAFISKPIPAKYVSRVMEVR